MPNRLLLSRVGLLYHDPKSGWVWNDPLRQRTYHISPDLLADISRADESTVDDVLEGLEANDRALMAARLLKAIESKVLVFEGSEEHLLEQEVSSSWSEYGRIAEAYHYSSRTETSSPFDPESASPTAILNKAISTPAPPAFTRLNGLEYVSLPSPQTSILPRADLVETLIARRTSRDFECLAIGIEQLSAILDLCARPKRRDSAQPLVLSPVNSYYKVVPSGGGRHPTEWFLNILRVDGVEPGAYHYDPEMHAIGRVGDALEGAVLTHAAGGQEWVSKAAVQIVFVSQTERNRWKYQMARAYRALNLDVGHISQAIFLVATAMVMKVAFIGSFRDEPWEHAFRLRHWDQLVLGMMILGGTDKSKEGTDNA